MKITKISSRAEREKLTKVTEGEQTLDAKTIDYYQKNAPVYYAKTIGTNMGAIYKSFFKYMVPRGKILDVGCGSGRDLKAFKTLGYEVVGLDPSEQMAHLAAHLIGEPVGIREARQIHEVQAYDGIWACASLIHIPREGLNACLRRIAIAAKDRAAFYCSFKRGERSWRDDTDRLYTGVTTQELCKLLNANGFYVEDMWQSGGEDNFSGRANWLNAVCTRRWKGGDHIPVEYDKKNDSVGATTEVMEDA